MSSAADERKRLGKLKAEQRRALELIRAKQNAAVADEISRGNSNRLQFLMQQSDIFAHFLGGAGADEAAAAASGTKKAVGGGARQGRRRVSEAAEDKAILAGELNEERVDVRLTKQPECIKYGTLRNYQLEGLNWLVRLYDNGINGILADEMGLGKTCQSIALLGYLSEARGVTGPHLVIVPKSTVGNWMREFGMWLPSARVVRLLGSKEERADVIATQLKPGAFDVIVTSYQIAAIEKAALNKFSFHYVIIDEAHRIKNEHSQLSVVVRGFQSANRLLITGTPLQNNLHELWALLNFLLPDVFSSADDFDKWFDLSDKDAEDQVINKLHKVLRPFLLRRLKSDVAKDLPPKREIKLYVGLSEMQRDWYRKLLMKDLAVVNTASGKTSKVRLMNIAMQLRKVSNHPYIFENAEPGPPYTNGEHLVTTSGKLVVLDMLLKKLKQVGSRVLIFSQMTRLLDILEDYLVLRDYAYCRIDGQTSGEDREDAIDAYNKPNSELFVFLLSTRAGGLGINLATADTVVLYDSDWNPQMDLQAQDRAHRIGQTRPVTVYRLITENTIEEKIVERAEMKLYLDARVIEQGRLADKHKSVNKDELLSMIRFGADQVFRKEGAAVTETDIDAIIARGTAKTEEFSKLLKQNENTLASFKMDGGGEPSGSLYEYEGKDYSDVVKADALKHWIEPPKRERKQNYAVDDYYRNALNINGGKSKQKAAPTRPPGQPVVYDHQLYPPRLYELIDRETALWKRGVAKQKRLALKAAGKSDEEIAAELAALVAADKKREARKSGRKSRKSTVMLDDDDAAADTDDNAEFDESRYRLSDAEEAEKQRLLAQNKSDWSRRDFYNFVKACENHGRAAHAEIALEMGTRTAEEVAAFSALYWKFGRDRIDGFARYQAAIEKGEARLRRLDEMQSVIARKVALYRNPWTELEVPYTTRSKTYVEEEDQFLLCMTNELGYGEWEALKTEVRLAWQFRFDWFLKSRSAVELGRRVDSLVRMLEKEQRANDKQPQAKKKRVVQKAASTTATTATQAPKKPVGRQTSTSLRASAPLDNNDNKRKSPSSSLSSTEAKKKP